MWSNLPPPDAPPPCITVPSNTNGGGLSTSFGFLLTALLIFNSHTLEFTHLKCQIHWLLVSSELCNYHHNQFWTFSSPRKETLYGWITKMWYIDKMECYSAFKRKFWCAMTWMNLENILSSEISQSQRTSTIWCHFHEVPRVVKFIETENSMLVVRGTWESGEPGNGLLFNRDRVSIWEDENVLEVDRGEVSQCECT